MKKKKKYKKIYAKTARASPAFATVTNFFPSSLTWIKAETTVVPDTLISASPIFSSVSKKASLKACSISCEFFNFSSKTY